MGDKTLGERVGDLELSVRLLVASMIRLEGAIETLNKRIPESPKKWRNGKPIVVYPPKAHELGLRGKGPKVRKGFVPVPITPMQPKRGIALRRKFGTEAGMPDA